jgi:hypothetical protein
MQRYPSLGCNDVCHWSIVTATSRLWRQTSIKGGLFWRFGILARELMVVTSHQKPSGRRMQSETKANHLAYWEKWSFNWAGFCTCKINVTVYICWSFIIVIIEWCLLSWFNHKTDPTICSGAPSDRSAKEQVDVDFQGQMGEDLRPRLFEAVCNFYGRIFLNQNLKCIIMIIKSKGWITREVKIRRKQGKLKDQEASQTWCRIIIGSNPTNKRTNEPTYERTNERTNEPNYERTELRTHQQTNERTELRTHERKNRITNAPTEERTNLMSDGSPWGLKEPIT